MNEFDRPHVASAVAVQPGVAVGAALVQCKVKETGARECPYTCLFTGRDAPQRLERIQDWIEGARTPIVSNLILLIASLV